MRPQLSPFPPQKYIHQTVNTVIQLHLHQLFPSESTDIFGSSYSAILMKMIKLKIRIIFLRKWKRVPRRNRWHRKRTVDGGTGRTMSGACVRWTELSICPDFFWSTKFIAFLVPCVFHFIFKKMVINLPGKIVACLAWPKLRFWFEVIKLFSHKVQGQICIFHFAIYSFNCLNHF